LRKHRRHPAATQRLQANAPLAAPVVDSQNVQGGSAAVNSSAGNIGSSTANAILDVLFGTSATDQAPPAGQDQGSTASGGNEDISNQGGTAGAIVSTLPIPSGGTGGAQSGGSVSDAIISVLVGPDVAQSGTDSQLAQDGRPALPPVLTIGTNAVTANAA
jgi:hypothetical protein